jgi:hypothetical protein
MPHGRRLSEYDPDNPLINIVIRIGSPYPERMSRVNHHRQPLTRHLYLILANATMSLGQARLMLMPFHQVLLSFASAESLSLFSGFEKITVIKFSITVIDVISQFFTVIRRCD